MLALSRFQLSGNIIFMFDRKCLVTKDAEPFGFLTLFNQVSLGEYA